MRNPPFERCEIDICGDYVYSVFALQPRGLRDLVEPLQWRHNERDGVSNHQRSDYLLKRLCIADQRKHQSCALLAYARGIHRWPVNSPHKVPVTGKMYPLDNIIMRRSILIQIVTRSNLRDLYLVCCVQ